jgi:hypothetical protein
MSSNPSTAKKKKKKIYQQAYDIGTIALFPVYTEKSRPGGVKWMSVSHQQVALQQLDEGSDPFLPCSTCED